MMMIRKDMVENRVANLMKKRISYWFDSKPFLYDIPQIIYYKNKIIEEKSLHTSFSKFYNESSFKNY